MNSFITGTEGVELLMNCRQFFIILRQQTPVEAGRNRGTV
jgi:hypothetical protein